MPAAPRMTVWMGGPVEAAELFLSACARAGVSGAAEPLEGDAGIRCVVQAGGADGPDAAFGCDVLVAADAETSAWSGAARRWVLYDGRSLPGPLKLQSGAAALALPGPEPEAAAGALAALAGLDLETLDAALERRLRAEPSESAAARIQAARRAFASAAQQAGSARLSLASSGRRLPLLCGPEALGLGALAAGCTCFFAPEPGRGRGAAAWLLGLAARGGLSSCPASDENAALGAAAGAAAAGARALADLTAGSLAAAAEMLRCCAESGLPVVVLAADDGWRWPRGLPVAELRPADLCEARDLTAEAFNIAERRGVPVVVRAGAGLLGRWEASARQPAARPIVRGAWASGPQAGPEARAVPGQEGSIRVIKPLPADVLTRRRAALDEAEPPSEAALPQTSPLFPAPAAATLEEREPRRPEDFAPEGSDAALLLLARAWSEQGLQPKDIFVAVGGVPCRPRTYGALVPAGCAAAVAMGAKLANPALTVAALDDSEAVFSRGLAQLLHAARGDHDILVLLWERGAERAFELVKAQRLPAQDEAAAAAQLSQAVAHKGLSLAVCPCPAGLSAVPGAQDVQAYGEAPVTAAIDRRPALCARLLEELA